MQIVSPSLAIVPPVHLQHGAGSGNRLICPGFADQWAPFGGGLAWVDRQGLFLLRSTDAMLWSFPGEVMILTVWGPNILGVAIDCPEGIQWAALFSDEIEEEPWRMGSFCVPGLGQMIPLPTGGLRLARLPAGADTRLRCSLPGGHGLAWVDDKTVYRGQPGLRISVSGSLDFKPLEIFAGPQGAVFCVGDTRAALAPPSGPPFCFDAEVDTAGLRFSSDGKAVWCWTSRGVLHIEVGRPHAKAEWIQGEGVPLGSVVAPWILLPEEGVLRSVVDDVEIGGVVATAWAGDRKIVAGPGGAIWCANTTTCLTSHSALSGDHVSIHGSQVLVLLEDQSFVFNPSGIAPDSPDLPTETGERDPPSLTVTSREWRFGWEGSAVCLVRDLVEPE